MIFASSLAQFGSSIEEAEFKGEVGYISNKTSDMLQELYSETLKNIEEVRKYQKVK